MKSINNKQKNCVFCYFAFRLFSITFLWLQREDKYCLAKIDSRHHFLIEEIAVLTTLFDIPLMKSTNSKQKIVHLNISQIRVGLTMSNLFLFNRCFVVIISSIQTVITYQLNENEKLMHYGLWFDSGCKISFPLAKSCVNTIL
jgi:hypothetical protein